MTLAQLKRFIPQFKGDKSKHRQYTLMYEDLCQ